MKLCLVFVALGLFGCATAVVDPQASDAPSPVKDASADVSKPQPQPKMEASVEFDASTNETPDASSGTCSLQINYGSGGCQSCMQACCTDDNACASSSDCVAVIQCMNACPKNDAPCLTSCRSQHAQGASLLDAISKCMKSQCTGTCP